MDVQQHMGNGFLFNNFDPQGFRWAIDQAMAFHLLPDETRLVEIRRVMTESMANFTTTSVIDKYQALYTKLLPQSVA
jgi:glycogen synthase